MSEPKVAIVTGARGFLGAASCRALIEAGYRVVGLARAGTESLEGVEYRQMSLPDGPLASVLSEVRPSLLIHAAGPASVADSVTDPLRDFDGSVRVHAHILDAVRRESPETRVVVYSSAAVYGNPASLPITEDADMAPISPYGHHKVMCERLLREFHQTYGVPTCGLRVFSAYGAGLRRQLLWDTCMKAAQGGTVRLFGTGAETRDYIHADDVARAAVVAGECAPCEGNVYNLASGVETSVRDVATRLIDELGFDVALEFSGETRAGDPLRWQADVSRMREIGFAPRVEFSEGIAGYARWFRDQL